MKKSPKWCSASFLTQKISDWVLTLTYNGGKGFQCVFGPLIYLNFIFLTNTNKLSFLEILFQSRWCLKPCRFFTVQILCCTKTYIGDKNNFTTFLHDLARNIMHSMWYSVWYLIFHIRHLLIFIHFSLYFIVYIMQYSRYLYIIIILYRLLAIFSNISSYFALFSVVSYRGKMYRKSKLTLKETHIPKMVK